ncbi:MAG TPA: archease [Nitrososphaeraceae archaeon]|nr:archease [Nitrososphaeraceae archaeon]
MNSHSFSSKPPIPGPGFRYLDHISDVIIEAFGTTLEEAFANSAKGLVSTMFDINYSPEEQIVCNLREIEIEAEGYDYNSLLYDWLEKVLLIVLVDRILVSSFNVKIISSASPNAKAPNTNDHSICYFYLEGMARGEPISLDRHEYKVEVKAITYHGMEVKQDNERFVTKFLVDL